MLTDLLRSCHKKLKNAVEYSITATAFAAALLHLGGARSVALSGLICVYQFLTRLGSERMLCAQKTGNQLRKRQYLHIPLAHRLF